MMIKRNITTVAMVAALVVAAACGSDSDSDAGTGTDATSPSGTDAGNGDSGETRTIQLLTFNSPEQVQPVIDAWLVDHPDVQIEVQSVPFGDLNAVVQTRVGGGDPDVDVYLVDQPRVASLASDGLLLDLTDEIEIPDGAILPEALEAGRFDGKMYAMPVQTSTQLLFYNPDLLEAAGIDIPSTDPDARLTWEEVVAAGEAVQANGAAWGLVFEQGASPYQVLPLAESLGGGNGLTGDDLLTPALTTDGWVEAMNWWRDVHENGVVPRGMGFGVTTETFASGDAPFFLAGPWNLGILGSQELPFEFGVTAHPFFADGEAVTPTGSFHWGVNPASDNIEDAIDLVEFVSTTLAGSSAVAEGDPNIPTHIEALDAYLAGDAFGGGIGELIRFELDNTAVLRPVTTGYIEFETILAAALEDIRNGLEVQATLDNAESELATALGQ